MNYKFLNSLSEVVIEMHRVSSNLENLEIRENSGKINSLSEIRENSGKMIKTQGKL